MRAKLRAFGVVAIASFAVLFAAGAAAPPSASPTPHPRPHRSPTPSLATALRNDLVAYLVERRKAEHISTLSVSVSRGAGASPVTATASVPNFGPTGTVTPKSLFQIGSNTKSFTSAAILQLEAEGKLRLDQTVGKWLPQYPQWRTITIRRLLNMTSGIPTYDNEQTFQRAYAASPHRRYTPEQLLAYVAHVPLVHGYYYSNSAYLLAQLIVERASGHSYAYELHHRLFAPLGLDDTYYNTDVSPAPVLARTVPGYFANTDEDTRGLRPLLNRNVRGFSLSWAQGAGGIVSTPSDLIRWVRALYRGPVLATEQRKELQQIVSMNTGHPIAATSAGDPRGFGLGVGQMRMEPIGRFWFYQGTTFGYRVLYMYAPESDLVFALGANSQPSDGQDQIGKLMATIYRTIRHYGR